MTVSTTTRKVAYAGDGSSVTFAVPFPFLSVSHLQALRTTAGGTTESMSIIASTGAGSPSGGSITVSQPVGAGNSLLILRDTPETQETDYLANDAFPAESHERALDKLTMLIQEMQEESSRALRLPPLEGGVSPLPPASQRAGMFLGFGPGGAPQMVPPTSSPGGGRFSLGGRRIISSTAPNAYLTAADPSWISVDVASGVGMPVGGTIHIDSTGVEVGRVFLIQIYSSSGAYPSSGSIQVLCDGFRRYYFSFEPNATPSLAMELVFDGEAWSAIGPDPDWGNTFLPLSAGSGKALTGDLHFEDKAVFRLSSPSGPGNFYEFWTYSSQLGMRIDSNGNVGVRLGLTLGEADSENGGDVYGVNRFHFAQEAIYGSPSYIDVGAEGSVGGLLRYTHSTLGTLMSFRDDGRAYFTEGVQAGGFRTGTGAGVERISASGNAYFSLFEATAAATFWNRVLGRATRNTGLIHAEFGGAAAGNAGIIGWTRGSDGALGAFAGFATETEVNEFRETITSSDTCRRVWWMRTSGNPAGREVMRLHHSGGLSLGSITDPGAGRFTTASGIGFHGVAAPTSRPAVSGSRGANAALQSLLAALHACGIINDTTT